MNVSLPKPLKQWVERQVETGGYGTASEFIRDMLRQAKARQLQDRIDPSLLRAVEAGATIEMDDADWAKIRRSALISAKRARRQRAK